MFVHVKSQFREKIWYMKFPSLLLPRNVTPDYSNKVLSITLELENVATSKQLEVNFWGMYVRMKGTLKIMVNQGRELHVIQQG